MDDAANTVNFVVARYIKKVSKKLSDWAAIRVVVERPEDMQYLPTSMEADRDGKVYFTVCGVNLPMMEGCLTKFYGKWREANGYTSFYCDNAEVLPPNTKRGIVAFLSGKQFPGIGKVTAERIADRFGDNTFDVIENDPNELLSIRGITPDRLGTILNNYKSVREYALLSRLLFPYGISAEKVVRISKRFGSDAMVMVEKNPYCLSTVRGITFMDADKVGRGMGKSLSSPQRIEAGVAYTLDKTCTSDTYADIDGLIADSMAVLNNGIEGEPPVSYPAVVEALRKMSSDKQIKVVGKAVFSRAFNDAEYNAAVRLCDLLASPLPAGSDQQIRKALHDLMASSETVKYSQKQQDAIAKCVGSRVAVLTGGPGTGKTTVVSGIIKVYTEVFGGDVILMAPTGKAARRMTESTGLPATTIHSRLHLYTTDADALSEPKPITGNGYVIVDESSMIDAKLMESLMLAIQSTDLHLLFVGDVNQLPSVGAGSVLNDLIKSGVIPVARLTEIFRQKGGGGTIVDDANKVNNGQFDLEYDDTFRMCKVNDEQTAVNAIKKLYASEVAEWGIENVALLCPRRRAGKDNRFQCASDALNPVLQDLINPAEAGKDFAVIRRKTWRVGDRVMEWKNTEEASNGDVGTITGFEESPEVLVHVKWENGNESVLNTEAMESVDFAYALSIHKSQGSEYQSVIIPLIADERCSMFQRNLLYTAITRAKKRVILVGDEGSINQCISSVSSNNRKTMFADRLRAHAAK